MSLPESCWLYENGSFSRSISLPGLPAQTAAVLVELCDAAGTLKEKHTLEPAASLALIFTEAELTDQVRLTPLDSNGAPTAVCSDYRFDFLLTPDFLDYINLSAKIINDYEGQVQQDGAPSCSSGRLIARVNGPLPDVSAFEPAVILDDAEGHFILQFLSSAAAQRCADFLNTREEVIYVEPDRAISVSLPEEDDSPDISDGVSPGFSLN